MENENVVNNVVEEASEEAVKMVTGESCNWKLLALGGSIIFLTGGIVLPLCWNKLIKPTIKRTKEKISLHNEKAVDVEDKYEVEETEED